MTGCWLTSPSVQPGRTGAAAGIALFAASYLAQTWRLTIAASLSAISVRFRFKNQ